MWVDTQRVTDFCIQTQPSFHKMPEMNGTKVEEREVQKSYWQENSKEATVEAMMLDSKAADIDRLERPEVRQMLEACRAILHSHGPLGRSYKLAYVKLRHLHLSHA